MTFADQGLVARIPIGNRYLYLGKATVASGDTTGNVTVKATKVDAFYLEGMTKYSVSGSVYSVTFTDFAATQTIHYWYIGR